MAKKYNACIINECGTTFSECLGKKQGDAAIAKCKSIQTQCVQKDNGLASRMMNVFAGIRQNAEIQVQRDEQHLYDLRTEMENVCKHSGAMFDQRSLDCVYTVNFFANAEEKPYASKKAYAGSVFSCDPGWFGIDVTTFKENAYRLTRSQTAASSAMLGAGVGVGVGAITSGAIDRAVKTQKAKKELKAAKKDAEDLRAESEAANVDTDVKEQDQTPVQNNGSNNGDAGDKEQGQTTVQNNGDAGDKEQGQTTVQNNGSNTDLNTELNTELNTGSDNGSDNGSNTELNTELNTGEEAEQS